MWVGQGLLPPLRQPPESQHGGGRNHHEMPLLLHQNTQQHTAHIPRAMLYAMVVSTACPRWIGPVASPTRTRSPLNTPAWGVTAPCGGSSCLHQLPARDSTTARLLGRLPMPLLLPLPRKPLPEASSASPDAQVDSMCCCAAGGGPEVLPLPSGVLLSLVPPMLQGNWRPRGLLLLLPCRWVPLLLLMPNGVRVWCCCCCGAAGRSITAEPSGLGPNTWGPCCVLLLLLVALFRVADRVPATIMLLWLLLLLTGPPPAAAAAVLLRSSSSSSSYLSTAGKSTCMRRNWTCNSSNHIRGGARARPYPGPPDLCV